MDPKPQCYIPKPKVIGLLVLEKTWWPFVPPTHGGSTWNLASIGPVVLKKMVDGLTTDDRACLYYKLTDGRAKRGAKNEIQNTTGYIFKICVLAKNEPPNDKTNQMACVPSENSDQPGSDSSLCSQWVAKDPSFLHVDSEDSDQTEWMPRLIKVFAWRTGHFVGFVVTRLISLTSSKKHVLSLLIQSLI